MAKSATKPKMAGLTAVESEESVVGSKTESTEDQKPTTTKAQAKKATKKGDLIVDTAAEVESITKTKALKLALKLVDDHGMSDFKLGGLLLRIQEQKWWDGQWESFKAYIENEVGLAYRKAMYLIAIYTGLVESGVAWDQVKGIGWSKLRYILDFLNPETVDEWVERCAAMNTLEIQEYVKSLKSGASSTEVVEGEETTTTVTTLTFKVHPDQKETIQAAIEKKKEEIGTDYPTVALEGIVMDYIEGNLGKPKVVEKEVPAKLTDDAVMEYLKEVGHEKAAELVITVYPELAGD